MKLSWYGFNTTLGGYGILNNQWLTRLFTKGVDVCTLPTFTPKPGTREWEVATAEERYIFNRPFTKHKIGISGTTPFEFHHNTSEVKIAMTMAESSRLGEPWVKACNGMTHILVPNEFYRRVFVDSGVTQPVTVQRNGIDYTRFNRVKRKKKDVFTFGICGYLNDRKSALEVATAFTSEFGKNEPVRLKMHTTNGFFRYHKNFKDPRISLTWDHKTFDQLNDWYHSLDCFVFPSKAEGIGYPPREALATGCPTIITNYSGLEDLAPYAYALNDFKLEERTDMPEQPGCWAVPNIQELMYWMRWVYEHADQAYETAYIMSIRQGTNFSWDRCVDDLILFLSNHG